MTLQDLVSTKFTSQINGYNAASRNINDAITMLQTADGALAEISLMDRMRELAVQSSSDTYTSSDRLIWILSTNN